MLELPPESSDRKRGIMRTKALILLTLAVLGLACRAFQGKPAVGKVAPSFTLRDTAGVNHSLSEWHGKVVLLTFWQSG